MEKILLREIEIWWSMLMESHIIEITMALVLFGILVFIFSLFFAFALGYSLGRIEEKERNLKRRLDKVTGKLRVLDRKAQGLKLKN